MHKLTKIRLLVSRGGKDHLGNDHSASPGDIIEVPSDEAERYVSAGFAEYPDFKKAIPMQPVDGVHVATADHTEVETTDRKTKRK